MVQRLSVVPKVVSVLVVLAVVVSMVVALYPRGGERHVTADFPRTVSLYEGSDVRILGVPVGTVESIQPRGDVVRVRMSYDAKYKLPSDVKAAIVSPSIVGDRFVQLAPVYTGGRVLADGAYLSEDRTATPVELDKVFQTLDDLSVALGPKGANKRGALDRLLEAGAKGLDGKGAKVNQTVGDLSKLTTTLSDNKHALFGSVRQVERFVRMLKTNDKAVRRFNANLGNLSTVLAGERKDLAKTLRLLAVTLRDVDDFVKHNRKALRTNVHDLTELSKTIVKNRKALDEAFTSAPTALSNLAFTYNPKTGTLDNRSDLLGAIADATEGPGRTVCQLLGLKSSDPLCKTLQTTDPLTAKIVGKVLDQVPLFRPGPGPKPNKAIDPDPVSDSVAEMLAVRP